MNQVSERMAIINFNSHSDQMIRFFVSSTHQHESRIEEKSIQYAWNIISEHMISRSFSSRTHKWFNGYDRTQKKRRKKKSEEKSKTWKFHWFSFRLNLLASVLGQLLKAKLTYLRVRASSNISRQTHTAQIWIDGTYPNRIFSLKCHVAVNFYIFRAYQYRFIETLD